MRDIGLQREIELCLRAGPEQWPALKQTLSAPAVWVLEYYDSRSPQAFLMWLFSLKHQVDPSVKVVARRGLRLLYSQADAFEVWHRALDPLFARHWPACEIVAAVPEDEPPGWLERWSNAGGLFYDGRAVALRDDPVWVKFSEYGQPYPPFDWADAFVMVDLPPDDPAAKCIGDHFRKHRLDTHF